jgi:arsenite methyltransferase
VSANDFSPRIIFIYVYWSESMDTLKRIDEIREAVRQQYARVAEGSPLFCECGPSCCQTPIPSPENLSQELGYTASEMSTVPQGANMGLGCGNPQAIAALTLGEIVLDLGSGGGFDCFLAAQQVGDTGQVIGIDMTPEMITRARANAERGGYRNVEFRLGNIEKLPVADNTVDVIISNCVINLSPDKPRVFAEAYRVLRPGGRLAISDVVAFGEIPEALLKNMVLYTTCVSGASSIAAVEAMLRASGFVQIRVAPKSESKNFMRNWAPMLDITDYVVSTTIEAVKPSS